MTLSPGAKVQPNRSTLRSPAGFNAACSSMLRERAPTPPRFIGQSTWMSRTGSRPKRLGIRVHQLDDAHHSGFRVVGLHEVEITLRAGRAEIGNEALVDAMRTADDAALRGLPEHLSEADYRQGAR